MLEAWNAMAGKRLGFRSKLVNLGDGEATHVLAPWLGWDYVFDDRD